MDAIYLSVRPAGPREACWWRGASNLTSSCVLLDVCLGQRERLDDWLELGRGLTARGLAEPRLVVGEGASGLVATIGELWPGGDRRRCAVHRLRNVLAKLPKQLALHDRLRPPRGSARPGLQRPARAGLAVGRKLSAPSSTS